MRANLLLSGHLRGSTGLSKLMLMCCWLSGSFFSSASCSYFPFISSQQISPLPSSTPTISLGSFDSFVSVRASEVYSTAVYTTSTDRKTTGGIKLLSHSGVQLGSVTPVSDGCLFHLLLSDRPVLLTSCENSPTKAVFSVQTLTPPSSTASAVGPFYTLTMVFQSISGSVLAAGVELRHTSYVIGANKQEVFILDLSSGEEGPVVELQDQDATAAVGVFEFREMSYCLVSKSGHRHHIIRKSDLGPVLTGESPFVSRFHNVDDRDELGTFFAFDTASMLWSTDLQDFSIKSSLDLEPWGLPNCLMIIHNFKFLLTAPILAGTTGRVLAIRRYDLTMPTSLPIDLHRIILHGSTAMLGLNDSHLAVVFSEESSRGLYFMILHIDPCQARDGNDVCLRCPEGLLRDSEMPNNNCVSQNSISQGQGVRQSDETIMPCTDTDCIDCLEDFARCRQCRPESKKLLFEDKCIHLEQLPAGFGADSDQGLAKNCEASNCLNCRQNNKECAACDSGFRLIGQLCEACEVRHCRSCPSDRAICSECDEIGGYFLESERKCSAAEVKLKQTAYFYKPMTIRIEFTGPIRVDNLTGLMHSTNIRSLEGQRVYQCISKLCEFRVDELTNEIVISLFPEHLSSKPPEAFLTIDSSPDFSITSTHSSSWTFKDYPITVKQLYLAASDSGPLQALNSLIAFLVYNRIPLNVLSSLLAPSVSTLIDEAFSFLHIHRYYKGERLGVIKYFHLKLMINEAGSVEKALLAFLHRRNSQDCYQSLYSTGEYSDCLMTIMMVRCIVSIIAAAATTAVLSVLWRTFRICFKCKAEARDQPRSSQSPSRPLSLKSPEKQFQCFNPSSRYFFQRIEGMRLLALQTLLMAVTGIKDSQQQILAGFFIAAASSYFLLSWLTCGRLLYRLAKSRKHLKNASLTVRDHMRHLNMSGGFAVHQFEGYRFGSKIAPILVPAANIIKDLILATFAVLLVEHPTAQSLTIFSSELCYLFVYLNLKGKLSSFEHASESLLLLIKVCLFGIRSADCLFSLDATQRQTWKGWTTAYLMIFLVIACTSITVVSTLSSIIRRARQTRSPLPTRVDPKPILKVKSIFRSSVRGRQTGQWINRIQLHKEYIQLISKRASQVSSPGQPSGDRCTSPQTQRSEGSVSARHQRIQAKPTSPSTAATLSKV